MVAKRERMPNVANVSAKARKVSHNLSQVVGVKENIAFRTGVLKVAEDITNNPQALKKVQALMEAETAIPDLPAEEYFTAAQSVGGLHLMKAKYAADEVLPNMCSALATRLVKALGKVDPKVHTKLQMRGCMVSEKHDFGPRKKSDWHDVWEYRAKACKCEEYVLVYDPSTFVIDWQRSGHYALQPPLPDGADKENHVYKYARFLGQDFAIPSDIILNGTWSVELNWDHLLAYATCADKPWRKEPLIQCVGATSMLKLAPEMVIPPTERLVIEDLGKVLAIENVPTQALATQVPLHIADNVDNRDKEGGSAKSEVKTPETSVASSSSSGAPPLHSPGKALVAAHFPKAPARSKPKTAAPKRAGSVKELRARSS